MRIRAAQLACLLLLLTSAGAAGASMRRKDFWEGRHFASQLLQHAAVTNAAICLTRQPYPCEWVAPAKYAATPFVWTMRPPAAYSVHVQAVTGSGI